MPQPIESGRIPLVDEVPEQNRGDVDEEPVTGDLVAAEGRGDVGDEVRVRDRVAARVDAHDQSRPRGVAESGLDRGEVADGGLEDAEVELAGLSAFAGLGEQPRR